MKVHITLAKQDVALQISELINKHNGWQINYSAQSILNSNIDYFIELHQNLIIGCIGLQFKNNLNSKIVHLCVHDLYRKKGIGKKLITTAINNCKTNNISTQVRNTNFNSLYLFYRLGFINKHKFYIGQNLIICISKTINKGMVNNGINFYNKST